jgi:hypothetical protein
MAGAELKGLEAPKGPLTAGCLSQPWINGGKSPLRSRRPEVRLRTAEQHQKKVPETDILPLCKFELLNHNNHTRLGRAKSAAASLDAYWAQLSAMHWDFRARLFLLIGSKSSTRRSMVITLSLSTE